MSKYEQFFIEIAKSLDLNDTEIETITRLYNAVGEFLAESDILKPYSPKVFPQGSMRLGTVVKPLSRDDYDIDLVCELQNGTGLSPKQVKQSVGYALQNSKFESQLEKEHGRCWTLDYSANPPYHLDILPGIEITGGRVKATIKRNNIYVGYLQTQKVLQTGFFLYIQEKDYKKTTRMLRVSRFLIIRLLYKGRFN